MKKNNQNKKMKICVVARCVRPQLQNWQLSDLQSEDSSPHPPAPPKEIEETNNGSVEQEITR